VLARRVIIDDPSGDANGPVDVTVRGGTSGVSATIAPDFSESTPIDQVVAMCSSIPIRIRPGHRPTSSLVCQARISASTTMRPVQHPDLKPAVRFSD
jgi:hypothetical protein